MIALFDAVVPAETAARRLLGWMSSDIETTALLTKADNGRLAVRKLGPRETRKGAAVGVVIGALAAATTSGGPSLFKGVAVGASAGAAIGAFFRKDVQLSHHTRSRIAHLLSPDGAALVVVVPTRQAAAVTEKLVEYGGTPDGPGTEPRASAAPASSALTV